jgi:hypothetical protein
MDFFKFNYDTDQTILERGERINNIDRSTWIERYSDPGEFSFEAKVSTGLRDFLPVGTIISHVDTLEVMIVENHEISETQEEDPTITITGRTFVSFFENRIVGVNQARASSTRTPYILAADVTWEQLVYLINDHIVDPYDSDDNLERVRAESDPDVHGVLEESVERNIEFGPVLGNILQILKIDDLGIKTIRPNLFGVGSVSETIISIYSGVDRSKDVLFSWKSGDLEAAQYLFSNKNYYNSALVVGTYVVMMVDDPTYTKYDRRIMIVDGTDIDGYFGGLPTGVDLTNVEYGLTIRGYLAIVNQKNISIMQTDMSKTAKYQYRRDFNVGDLISLDGNFGQIAIFKVVEYAEIEDENGESGHPTLAPPGV